MAGATYNLRIINDANSTAVNWLQATRSANTISGITYGNATDKPPHTFQGNILHSDGTAPLPSMSFLNDTNNGFYYITTDSFGLSTAGALRFQFGAAGQLGIGGATYGTAETPMCSGGASAAPVWGGALSVPAAYRRTAVISPGQLVANTDNWAPTGLSTCSVIRLSTDASRNITGITAQGAGTKITLVNTGAQDAVLVHNATSTAANQFLCPGAANFTLNGGDSVEIWYDSTSSRWRVIAF